jgi:hypothetical protein
MPAIDVALREIRRERADCYRLLATRPSADTTDRLLEEVSRLSDLRAAWLELEGADPL